MSYSPTNIINRLAKVILPVAVVGLVACSETPNPQVELDLSASKLRTRLMTSEQYGNTIAYIFGEDIRNSVLPPIPPMARTDGLLASGAAFVGVTSDQISQIQQTAAVIAAKVVDEEHRDFLVPCRPESFAEPAYTYA